jgi:cbb3-type cytochrome oxidase subunit 3
VKQYFANADAGLIGLLFFFAFFVAILIWVFRPGSKSLYTNHGQIPLKDDNNDG